MHRYEPSTTGERLYQYIYRSLEDDRTWRYLQNTIRPIGNSKKLALYYREHAALTLTCKLIASGKHLVHSEEENTSLFLSIVEQAPWNHFNSQNRLLRLLSSAIHMADRPISPGVKNVVRAYAKQHHPHCYICGITLNFSDDKSSNFYTAEHLWPSSYGGDSAEDNLLPACATCNVAKGNIVNWISTDVHSLFLGVNPHSEKLNKITFKRRYALYNRAAWILANECEITLKKAFIKLGSWADTRVNDITVAANMFNLKTHREIDELENYEDL